jgi:predicted nucleic acid-binding protein
VIVVDTNVLVHYWLETSEYAAARALLTADPHWHAPYLWRSEFCNAVTIYMRHRNYSLERAREASRLAELQMYDHEYFVDRMAVLDLVASSTCTAYDCEFVALARELRAPLITTDKQILREFPGIARPLADYR